MRVSNPTPDSINLQEMNDEEIIDQDSFADSNMGYEEQDFHVKPE